MMKTKMQVNIHIVYCRRQLPFVACEVACNGCDLSLSEGAATVKGGDAVASGRWADAPSDLSAGYRDTTQCDQAVAQDTSIQAYVRQLEQDYDATGEAEAPRPRRADDFNPEQLMQELEDFLRRERDSGAE